VPAIWAVAGNRLIPAKPGDSKAIESGMRTEDSQPRLLVSG
jgi:hypothetical protein